jgi:hypothetical protein
MAMDALDQSDELIRHGAELRARSARARAAADEKMEKSRRLIAAAAKAKVVMCAPYRKPTSRAVALPPPVAGC